MARRMVHSFGAHFEFISPRRAHVDKTQKTDSARSGGSSDSSNPTGEGITATIQRGLELVAAGGAYRNLRALKGKVKLQVDLKFLRKDR